MCLRFRTHMTDDCFVQIHLAWSLKKINKYSFIPILCLCWCDARMLLGLLLCNMHSRCTHNILKCVWLTLIELCSHMNDACLCLCMCEWHPTCQQSQRSLLPWQMFQNIFHKIWISHASRELCAVNECNQSQLTHVIRLRPINTEIDANPLDFWKELWETERTINRDSPVDSTRRY